MEKHAHPPRLVYCAIYTRHLLASQSFEFLMHITSTPDTANTSTKEGYPVTLLPLPRNLTPRLGLGNTWLRQLRSGSCHHPTAATKYNEQQSQATANPVEKHAHPPRAVYCAIYTQHLLASPSFESISNLHITSTPDAALIRCINVFYQGRLSHHRSIFENYIINVFLKRKTLNDLTKLYVIINPPTTLAMVSDQKRSSPH